MNYFSEQEAAAFFEVDRETLLNKIALYRHKFSSEQLSETKSGEFQFTEQGIWILSTVLSSPKAIEMHLKLIRTVVNDKDFSVFDLFKIQQ